jgi:cytochrome P450
MKEILSNKLGHYESPPLDPFSDQVLRQGLVGLKGEKWAQLRRIIAPAFHLDHLKVKTWNFSTYWSLSATFLRSGV